MCKNNQILKYISEGSYVAFLIFFSSKTIRDMILAEFEHFSFYTIKFSMKHQTFAKKNFNAV